MKLTIKAEKHDTFDPVTMAVVHGREVTRYRVQWPGHVDIVCKTLYQARKLAKSIRENKGGKWL